MPLLGWRPVRPFNDFIGKEPGSEVQNPEIQHGSQVFHNLFFYQTNYFITFASIFTLVGIMFPAELIMSALAAIFTIVLLSNWFRSLPVFPSLPKRHPGIYSSIVLLGGFLMTARLGSLMTFLLGIALPFTIILVHASKRQRKLDKTQSGRGPTWLEECSDAEIIPLDFFSILLFIILIFFYEILRSLGTQSNPLELRD